MGSSALSPRGPRSLSLGRQNTSCIHRRSQALPIAARRVRDRSTTRPAPGRSILDIKPPPYRADHVGSLLRPPALKAARKAHYVDKTMSAEALREVEDNAIVEAVRMQEAVGLKAVTDGEFRRAWWHFDFMGMLTGLDLIEREGGGIQFHGTATKAEVPVITGKLDFPDDHPMLAHYKYLASVTKVTPKISIPGPSAIHFRVAEDD